MEKKTLFTMLAIAILLCIGLTTALSTSNYGNANFNGWLNATNASNGFYGNGSGITGILCSGVSNLATTFYNKSEVFNKSESNINFLNITDEQKLELECSGGYFVTALNETNASMTCTVPTAADVDPGVFPSGDYTLNNVSFNSTTDQVVLKSAPNGTITLAFGDGDTGWHESADDNMRGAVDGTDQIDFTSAWFRGISSNNFAIAHSIDLSNTSPHYSWIGDTDTGVSHGAADEVGLVAGGVEGLKLDAAGNTEILRNISFKNSGDRHFSLRG